MSPTPPTRDFQTRQRDGVPAPAAGPEAVASDHLQPPHTRLCTDDLRRLYRDMLTARVVDSESIRLQRQGQLGVYASSAGQEAAQVGSAAAMRPTDWLFPAYREMGATVQRRLPPEAMLAVWRGAWYSGHDPHDHRYGLLTVPLATQALHAVGFAMGLQRRRPDETEVVLCYLGDGATSQGDAHEAFNFAGVFDAPVVFLIQNNQYAISARVADQTRAASLADRAVGYGIRGTQCDGNDVLAVYDATSAALDHARRGRGPSILEAMTYRIEPHTTADDDRRYRSDREIDSWRARDPIPRYRATLVSRGLWDDQLDLEAQAAADQEATRVREAIERMPSPAADDLFRFVLAEPSSMLEEQHREAGSYEDG